jgi:hypothetical protein
MDPLLDGHKADIIAFRFLIADSEHARIAVSKTIQQEADGFAYSCGCRKREFKALQHGRACCVEE